MYTMMITVITTKIIIETIMIIPTEATTTTTTTMRINYIHMCMHIYFVELGPPNTNQWGRESAVQILAGALRPAANAQQPCKEEKTPDSELPGRNYRNIMGR